MGPTKTNYVFSFSKKKKNKLNMEYETNSVHRLAAVLESLCPTSVHRRGARTPRAWLPACAKASAQRGFKAWRGSRTLTGRGRARIGRNIEHPTNVLGVDSNHSFQPFFAKTGSLKRRIPGKNGEGTPTNVVVSLLVSSD